MTIKSTTANLMAVLGANPISADSHRTIPGQVNQADFSGIIDAADEYFPGSHAIGGNPDTALTPN